jgi:hypothetical protein
MAMTRKWVNKLCGIWALRGCVHVHKLCGIWALRGGVHVRARVCTIVCVVTLPMP